MSAEWKLDDGRVIVLLTPEELSALPDGTALTDIFGKTLVKGTDYLDGDTRYGHLAFGVERAR